jgi:hypothetical protein
MYPFAQTNLQLFHQLRNAGYDEADLVCIHQAYQLACQVFTGFFRGSGKPFIAHLVGTASILATLETAEGESLRKNNVNSDRQSAQKSKLMWRDIRLYYGKKTILLISIKIWNNLISYKKTFY